MRLRKNNGFRKAIALGAVLEVVLAACGGDDDDDAGASADDTTTAEDDGGGEATEAPRSRTSTEGRKTMSRRRKVSG